MDSKNMITGVRIVTKRAGKLARYNYRKPRDLRELIKGTVSVFGDKVAFRFKRGGNFLSVKYSEIDKLIDYIGTALYDMGVGGKRVAVIGETAPEWVVAYLAVTNGDGVVVPFDKELGIDVIADFIKIAEVECLFYSGSISQEMEKIKANAVGVKYFIEMPVSSFTAPSELEPLEQPIPQGTSTFDQVAARGKYLLRKGKTDFVGCDINAEKMAAIIFTSGTTGTSKGVMLSHKNITAVVRGVPTLYQISSDEVWMSVLPIHHTYEMTCGILFPMNLGCTICINDSLKNISRNFTEYRPTVMVLVPLFINSMYKKIVETAKKNGIENKLKFAIKASDTIRHVGIDMREKLFAEIAASFGGRLTKIVSGGAPLNPEYVDKFESFGIEVVQGYGITECSPFVSVIPLGQKNSYSAGKPFEGISIYIDKVNKNDETGEILVKGDNVMLGYYQNPEATSAVLQDGWFRTGDYGRFDHEGFIYITGRKKNVIISSNGKNIFPEEIEEYLDFCSLVSECVVVGRTIPGDEDVHITAMIYPDFEEAERQKIEESEIGEAVKRQVAEVNKKLPIYKKIRSVEIRYTPFPKTTTKKIKRHEVL